jgi:hypothetical protein
VQLQSPSCDRSAPNERQGNPRAARAFLGLWVTCFCIAATPNSALATEPLSAQQHLDSAVRRYDELEFERALEELSLARQRKPTLEILAPIALYEGLLKAELRDFDGARGSFLEALKTNPELTLPRRVAPRVRALFTKVHEELVPSVKEPFVPSAERSVQPRPARFPWGPATVAGAGIVTASLGTYFGFSAQAHASEGVRARYQDESLALARRASGETRMAAGLFLAAGGAFATSVVWFLLTREGG